MLYKNENVNSEIKLSNNLSFVILIFAIFKFRNIGRSRLHPSKFRPPPVIFYISDVKVSLIANTSTSTSLSTWRILYDPKSDALGVHGRCKASVCTQCTHEWGLYEYRAHAKCSSYRLLCWRSVTVARAPPVLHSRDKPFHARASSLPPSRPPYLSLTHSHTLSLAIALNLRLFLSSYQPVGCFPVYL